MKLIDLLNVIPDENLFKTIGELYDTLVCFNIPTRYLNIDLDYKGLKVLCPVYGEEEEVENND